MCHLLLQVTAAAGKVFAAGGSVPCCCLAAAAVVMGRAAGGDRPERGSCHNFLQGHLLQTWHSIHCMLLLLLLAASLLRLLWLLLLAGGIHAPAGEPLVQQLLLLLLALLLYTLLQLRLFSLFHMRVLLAPPLLLLRWRASREGTALLLTVLYLLPRSLLRLQWLLVFCKPLLTADRQGLPIR